MTIDTFALSAQADRDENQDCCFANPASGLFVIADGLGGRPAGAQASHTAVQRFVDTVGSFPPAMQLERHALHAAVAAANQALLGAGEQNPDVAGLATTLSALLVVGASGATVHVGDSRIYRLRAGRLTQLTRDHTVASELLILDRLTTADVATHPLRTVLSRFIGSANDAVPDVEPLLPEAGDRFLLATDGLTAVLTDDDILRILSAETSPAEAMCRQFVEEALAQSPPDNLTAIVVVVSDPLAGRDDAPAGARDAAAPRVK